MKNLIFILIFLFSINVLAKDIMDKASDCKNMYEKGAPKTETLAVCKQVYDESKNLILKAESAMRLSSLCFLDVKEKVCLKNNYAIKMFDEIKDNKYFDLYYSVKFSAAFTYISNGVVYKDISKLQRAIKYIEDVSSNIEQLTVANQFTVDLTRANAYYYMAKLVNCKDYLFESKMYFLKAREIAKEKKEKEIIDNMLKIVEIGCKK